MTSTAAPANHIPCESCNQPVRRGDAVIRGDARVQRGWHPECYTVHRAVKDVRVGEVIGGTLTERMERAGVR